MWILRVSYLLQKSSNVFKQIQRHTERSYVLVV